MLSPNSPATIRDPHLKFAADAGKSEWHCCSSALIVAHLLRTGLVSFSDGKPISFTGRFLSLFGGQLKSHESICATSSKYC